MLHSLDRDSVNFSYELATPGDDYNNGVDEYVYCCRNCCYYCSFDGRVMLKTLIDEHLNLIMMKRQSVDDGVKCALDLTMNLKK